MPGRTGNLVEKVTFEVGLEGKRKNLPERKGGRTQCVKEASMGIGMVFTAQESAIQFRSHHQAFRVVEECSWSEADRSAFMWQVEEGLAAL